MRDGEAVYRLLRAEDVTAEGLRDDVFQTKYIMRPKAPKNACGSRDGESLLRREARTDAALTSEANTKYGADSPGAAVASVEAIRGLRAMGNPAVQLFYIYEDPDPPDYPQHVVIRYTDQEPLGTKQYARLARQKLKDLFSIVSR